MGSSNPSLGLLNSREKRKLRSRTKVKKGFGYLRLSVFKSNRYFYAQLIDDEKGITIASASTLERDLRIKCGRKVNRESAEAVGKLMVSRLPNKDFSDRKLVFDRGPYKYAKHTIISKFADVLRKSGLSF